MAEIVSTPQRAPRQIRQRRSPLQLVRANFYDLALLLRDSYLALLGFIAIMAISTLYLQHELRLPVPTALYESLKLLVFQSSYPLPANPLGAVLFFLIPLTGILLVVQGVLAFGRRLLDKGSRIEAWQVALASTYHQHVVVCGLGRVGIRVATRLIQAGYDVVVIERSWESERVARALAMRIPVIVGDAREPNTLRQAGIHRARAAAAVVSDDLHNVEVALACRALAPGLRVILRVFHEEIDRNLERLMGHGIAFSTSALAAPTYAAAALHRGIEYVLTVSEHVPQLVVATISIPAGGSLSSLEERHQVRALPSTAVAASPHVGQRVSVIGTLAAISALHSAQEPVPSATPDRVMVCGVGKVGYRVVKQLAQNPAHPEVIALHQEAQVDEGASYAQHIQHLPQVTVLEGDARHGEVLLAAGLASATAVAALTSNDFVNLQIALAARRARPELHVVLRVFSDALAERLVDLFGIHTTFSTSDLAAPTLAAAAVLPGATQAFFANGTLYSTAVREVTAQDRFHGRTVASLRERDGLLVLAVRTDATTTMLMPEGETLLTPGVEVTVLAPLRTLTQMQEAFPLRRGDHFPMMPERQA